MCNVTAPILADAANLAGQEDRFAMHSNRSGLPAVNSSLKGFHSTVVLKAMLFQDRADSST